MNSSTEKHSSKVCSHHFETDDVVKGRWIEGKDGKRIFYPWNNWLLKEDCPSYLSKPKKTVKRKLPTERKLITRKRRKKNTYVEFGDIVDDMPENGEDVDVEDKFPSQDPWALFDPKHCKVPPSRYWIDSKDEPSVALCVQFQLIVGKPVTSKSMHFNNGSAFLCVDGAVIGSSVLHPFDEEESLARQFSRIILDFESSEICPGVADEKYSAIKCCAGAVSEIQHTYYEINVKRLI